MQPSLFDTKPHFDGPTYEAARDQDRLGRQMEAVKSYMSDGKWRTLREISLHTYYPEASVSARLRDLRKSKFGAWMVERRYLADGVWEYRVK